MKRICKYINIPVSLFDTPDLTLSEKWVLMAIDSACDSDDGVSIGPQAIASMCNLSQKEVKETLKSLYDKGAVEIAMDDTGAKMLIPHIYNKSYQSANRPKISEDKPATNEVVDYEEIQEKWNNVCYMLPKIERMTPQRKRKTRTCLKNADASISDLFKVFALISTSSFLRGDSTNSTWRASYDWVVKSADNFQKIMEGTYHSRDFVERQDYEAIMREGSAVKKQEEDDFYK